MPSDRISNTVKQHDYDDIGVKGYWYFVEGISDKCNAGAILDPVKNQYCFVTRDIKLRIILFNDSLKNR